MNIFLSFRGLLAIQFILLDSLRTCICQCPQNFTTILGECIHISPVPMKFCIGQEYCHKLKGEIFFGDIFMKFNGKTLAEMPDRYWVGLTDLKNERSDNREGWTWTNGSLSPSSKSVAWNWSRPKASLATRDCTYYFKGSGLYETNCGSSSTVYPVCQPKAAIPSQAFFEAEAIPTELTEEQYAQEPCLQPARPAVSVIYCVALCNTQPNGWCVAVYYHKNRKECVCVLFTDATVKLSPDDGGWQKLVLKSL